MILAFYINENSSNTVIMVGYVLESLVFVKFLSLKDLIKRCERVITESETVNIYFLNRNKFNYIIIKIIGCFVVAFDEFDY